MGYRLWALKAACGRPGVLLGSGWYSERADRFVKVLSAHSP